MSAAPEFLKLWRLRTSQPGLIHIEDKPTEVGVITLCGFEIPSTAEAMSSYQPAERARSPQAPMCVACMAVLDRNRRINPNQI